MFVKRWRRGVAGIIGVAGEVGNVVLHPGIRQEERVEGVVAGPVGGVGKQLVGAQQLVGIHLLRTLFYVAGNAIEGIHIVLVDRDPELASIGNGHNVFPCGNLGEVVIVVFHQPPHQGLGRIEGENLTVLPQENRLGLHICAQRVDGTAVDGDLNGVDAGDAPHGIVVRIDLFSLLLTFLLFRLLLFLVDLLRLLDSLFGVLDLVFVHLFDRHQVIELVNH